MAAMLAGVSALAAVPAGFQDTLVQGSLAGPTALAFTPDGRLLITRQAGVLRIYAGGALLPTPAITLANVCSSSERGLLGVAVDPEFGASNNFVYFYYTVNKAGTCVNRVSQFVLPATNVINSATEVVLLDNMHSTAGNHNAGDLNFGKDGYLYVSVGDGGCDYLTPFGCAGANQASRNQNTLSGKILRITRDGDVPPDNPFLGAGTASCKAGDAAAGLKCQETFAWGLRNPFRFAMDPAALGVRFFINDVGQGAWEEIDLGVKGADYGWNCREGAHVNPEAGTKCSPVPPGLVDPIFEYGHSSCGSITGGAFLPTGFWPSSRDGHYFYSDYNCGTIFELSPKAGGGYQSADFATALGGSSAVHLVFGPYLGGTGLYYTNYQGGGQVRVISFTGAANRSPQARLAANPALGAPPLVVTFDAAGSSDPDGDPLTYVWDFGDGSPGTETPTLTTVHTYLFAGVFTAVLRAKDSSGALSDPVALVINVGNTPPVPSITAPAVGELYRVGQSVTLVGTATDAEEGVLPASRLTWNVLLHHDAHTHPFLTDVVGNNVALVTPPPEDIEACLTSFLEIRLTATDSAGSSTTVVQSFDPRKVAVNLETSPSGLTLNVNSTPFVAPATLTSWDNYALQVSAPDQAIGATDYAFVAWSDGGAQTHTFTTPSTATTLGAAFSAPTPEPQAVPFLAVTSGNMSNHVEWVNPSGPTFGSTVLVFRTDRSPTTPIDGTTVFTGGVAGDKRVFDHGGLTNGVTYHYAAFVNLALGGTSAGRFARGRPFDNTTGPVKWAYSTGATSLAPPGLGASIVAVSNDRVVHALARGDSGGTWPAPFAPVRLGGVVQTRPPVVSAGLVAGHPDLA
ncbi:MAG TPA: PQQ-dependent sugar dehydrogenase, partial [Vicinamibacteria bacterium]|nr:PQQ-dependent sugar dehydrogenase [Vicinamibacteria bacterium]